MKTQALKPRQLNAIQLLAMGKPVNQVAEILQVSTMTVFSWQKLPEFSSKLNRIATSGLEEIAKKMNATTMTAIETLQEIMCDLREHTTGRMRAAIGVLKSMSSVNGALEKSLRHRVADFDLQKRWSVPAPVLIPVQSFMGKDQGRKTHWFDLKPDEVLQGLITIHDDQARVYVVTSDTPPEYHCIHDRWPRIINRSTEITSHA